MSDISNRERKRRQKAQYHAEMRGKQSSSTPGKKKGIIATPIQRGMCRRNRSWKREDYAKVMASIGKRHGGGSS